MENNFQKYISAFNGLDNNDKKEEIIKHFKELFDYLKKVNNIDYPIYDDYDNDDEFLSVAFTYLITIKELSAVTFEKMNNDLI